MEAPVHISEQSEIINSEIEMRPARPFIKPEHRGLSRHTVRFLFTIDLLLLLISAGASILSYLYMYSLEWKIGGVFVFLVVFVYAVHRLVLDYDAEKPVPKPKKGLAVTKLCLLDDENHVIREWPLLNKIAFVVGRNSGNTHEADIDLNGVQYDALISAEHAVLNYSDGYWYIEDLYSDNGIRIQKGKDKTAYKISSKVRCRLTVGDIVYLAETRVLVK